MRVLILGTQIYTD